MNASLSAHNDAKTSLLSYGEKAIVSKTEWKRFKKIY